MTKVLVAYATKHGSTGEIAQVITDMLRACGNQADALPVGTVDTLSDYDAIIIGSALYSGTWMRDAVDFIRLSLPILARKPLFLFSSGPLGQGDPVALLEGFTLPENVSEMLASVDVQDVRVFHGKVDVRKLSLAELMLFKSVGGQSGDYRKWDAIKLWAQHVSDELEKLLAS